MEATMTVDRPAAALGFGAAFTRQFRLIWTSRRPWLLGAGLLGVMLLAGEPWNDGPMARFITPWPAWLILFPPIWAIATWYNEGPSNRLYMWSHPVDRRSHSLARLLAGLVWLWIAYVGLIAVGWLAAVSEGAAWQIGMVSPAGWVNYFAAPTLVYLIISMLTIPSDYPLRWLFGIIFSFPLVITLLDDWLDLDRAVETLMEPLANERWGLGRALVGPWGEDMGAIAGALRDRAYTSDLDLGTWWIALTAWTLFFAALLVWLAGRHPDAFPRWRGRSGAGLAG